ncbi:MAG TPA: ATP-binding protein [bacterium]|nr:ATP-binding protein [bacterium]HPN43615.1 ATP-binding protein [bacterium]
MTNWFNQQIKSKLFRKLLLAIMSATMIPVATLTVLALVNGYLSAGNSAWSVIVIIVTIILFALVLAGMVAFYISRYITTPIAEFTRSATEIARGKFSHKINLNSDDEIGKLAKLFNYMTTEIRRLHEMNLAQIIAERNKTQTIIKNIADGVIVTDPQLKVLILNSTAEKWFGLQQGEALDKNINEFITEPKLLYLIQEATENNFTELPSAEIEVREKANWKPRILQANAARVLHETEGLIGIATILRDITQQKEIDRMKTELVSMVAHELRSPLTSICGFSELLLDPELDKEQANEYATIILNESTRLGELINKFLDISRIESGRIQPQKAKVDLTETVQMVIGNNAYLAAQKEIVVDFKEPEAPVLVWADNGMMEQIILNLFSNAIKYSPDSTQIELQLIRENDHAIFRIKDQGFGIAEKDLQNIFNKFYRVTDNEQVRNINGSGLGLALVKQLVEIHNGRIEVNSTLGAGSVFSIFLPVSAE